MSKFLFFIIVGVVLYLMLTRNQRKPQGKHERAAPAPEPMIRCAYCDLHLPVSESLLAGGRHYCCEEHRRLGQG